MNDPRPKVLLLDDSRLCLAVAREALERAGYTVVATESPIGFNELVSEHRPAVLVVDVSMPALRGDTLVKIVLRRQAHRCPIVLHSDRTAEELQALARACGATAAVEKSADCASLVATVRRLVAVPGR